MLKIHETTMLHVVLCMCKLWALKLKKGQRFRCLRKEQHRSKTCEKSLMGTGFETASKKLARSFRKSNRKEKLHNQCLHQILQQWPTQELCDDRREFYRHKHFCCSLAASLRCTQLSISSKIQSFYFI
jgi:hypothetical protein